jgi:hypothetical protein
MWEVTFNDSSIVDYLFTDLFAIRTSWLIRLLWNCRQLCSLELFSGCGIITQSFADLKWRMRSGPTLMTSWIS